MPAGTQVRGNKYDYKVVEILDGFGLPVNLDYEPDRAGFLRYDEETGIVEKFDGDILGWNPIAGDNNYPTTLTYELGQLIIGRNGLSDLSVTIDKDALGLGLVENTALSTWAGSDYITNVGVITDGVWNGMALSPSKGGLPPGGTTGQVIKKNSATDYDVSWSDETGGGGGTSAWGEITGTLSDQIDLITALNGKQPSDSDLTAIAGLTPSNDDIIQRKAGAWTNRTLAQYKVDLALNNVDNTSDINKPVSTLQAAAIALKQDLLVSGTNIKTINGSSILGSGNITISGGTTYTFSDGLSETGGAVIIPANGITTAKINAGAVNDSKISDVAWGKITGTPTTVAGYGITDAVTLTGTQTITNKTINGANNTFLNIALGSLAQTGATLNQIIRWNGTAWVASTETTGGATYIFTASDFNESGATISLDYTNGQSAGSSTKGFLTAADWITFNGKQSQITTGSTAQYFRGDLSLATFPTNVSSWVNDAGYLVNITGKLTAGTNVSITGSGTTGSPYVISSTASGLTDGDKGDITVSASGTTWTVDLLAITNAKINDVAWSKITSTPTTVAGYGITDAVTLTGTQTLTNKTLTSPKINVGADATGDVYTRDGSGNLIRIPIGSAGQVLKVVSGLPAWAADATGGGGGATLADGDYGDVTVSGTGTAIFIDNGVVTNAKLANVATAIIKGRVTAGTGAVEDLTAAQATSLLDVFSSSLKGLVPLSGGGTVNFLRADGSWAAPSGGTTYTFTAADFNESGTTISIDYANGQAASTSQKGFLNSTDWNTFNNKQAAITTGSTAQYFRGDLSLATFPTTVSTFTNDSGYLTNITGKITAGTNVSITGSGTTGSPYIVNATLAGTVTSVAGTTNRITSTGGATPVIDISSSYAGQTSIITLGTITTGTWNGSAIASGYGGVPTGGTAGQILAKISGTNYATQWIPAPTLELIPGFGIIIDGENNISVDPDILAGGGITAITGDIAASGSGSVTGTIQANAVTTSKIADANVTNAKIASVAWSKITSTPTTVSGYGITDAVTLTGTQTITNKTLTSPKINVGSDATGDIYYRDSSGNLVRLAVGSNGQVLKITSGLPAWGTDATGGGGVSDGTFADIAISGTGSIYTITAGAVTNSKVAAGIDAVKLADGSVTNAELQYINSLTSNAQSQIDGKQATLVSGTNIKTVNGTSLLGSGNISISGGLSDGNYTDWTISGTGTVATINNNAITTAKILDANVTNAKLANSSITHGAPGTSGTAPNWGASSTALGGTATLNIPLASATSVTAGLVSKTNYDAWQAKQEALVSGTNIKTVNGSSILGSGNLSISTSLADGSYTDWTISSSGTVATINNNAITSSKILDANVTNSKLANMATLTVKGNNTGGSTAPLDLTVAQLNAILPVFTSSLNGLVPASSGGTTNFLRADGTFAAPTATVSLTDTRIGFGDGSNLITSDANFSRVSGTVANGGVPRLNTTSGEPEYLQELIINETNRAGLVLKRYGLGAGMFGNTIHAYTYGGNPTTPTAITSGTSMLSFGIRGHDGTATSYSEAAWITHATEDWSDAGHGTAMYWEIQRNGQTMQSYGGRHRAITLANSGFLGLNTSTPLSAFHVNALSGEAVPMVSLTHGTVSQPFTFSGAIDATLGTRYGMLTTSYGGGLLSGFSSGDNSALWVQGNIGHASPTKAPLLLMGSKTNGSGANTTLGSAEKVMSIFNGGPSDTEILSITGDGTLTLPKYAGSGSGYLAVNNSGVVSWASGSGGGGGSSQWDDITGGINSANGWVTINTTSPFPGVASPADDGLDLNSVLFMTGSDGDEAGGRTNNTTKLFRWLNPSYSSSEEATTNLISLQSSTDNILYFGGGSGDYNAATQIRFYAGANNTTLTGTQMLGVTSSGVTLNSSSNSYTMPTVRPASNGYVLTANTDGTTAWSAGGGGGSQSLQDVTDIGATTNDPIVFIDGSATSAFHIYNNSTNASFAVPTIRPTTGTNSAAALQIVPKGTGFSSTLKGIIDLFNTDKVTDATNIEYLRMAATGSTGYTINSDKNGTGTVRQISIQTASTDRMIFGASGAITTPSFTSGYLKVDGSGVWSVDAGTGGGGFSDPLTTNGDIIARVSGSTTRLAAGTAGYVLTSNGASSNISWQPIPGGGQDATYAVLTATTTDATETTMTGSMTVSNGEAGILEVTVYNVNSTNTDSWNAKYILRYHGTSSTVTQIFDTEVPLPPGSLGGSTLDACDVTIQYNGSGDVYMTVFGVGGVSLNWRAEIKKYVVVWSA